MEIVEKKCDNILSALPRRQMGVVPGLFQDIEDSFSFPFKDLSDKMNKDIDRINEKSKKITQAVEFPSFTQVRTEVLRSLNFSVSTQTSALLKLDQIFKDLLEQADISRIFKGNTAISIVYEIIICCEGNKNVRNVADASVYNAIFRDKYPDCIFVNAGGGPEMKTLPVASDMLRNFFNGAKLVLLRDRDDLKMTEVRRINSANTSEKFLLRREVENYLFHRDVVTLAFPEIKKDVWNDIFQGIDPVEGDMDAKTGELIEAIKTIDRSSNGQMSKERMKVKLAGKIKNVPELFVELESIIFS